MFNVIFVIGGPGVGKGTQCALLVERYPDKLIHISPEDVLREEQENTGSKWGAALRRNLAEGLIGPKEMVVDLLEDRLKALVVEDRDKFILLDGQYSAQKEPR